MFITNVELRIFISNFPAEGRTFLRTLGAQRSSVRHKKPPVFDLGLVWEAESNCTCVYMLTINVRVFCCWNFAFECERLVHVMLGSCHLCFQKVLHWTSSLNCSHFTEYFSSVFLGMLEFSFLYRISSLKRKRWWNVIIFESFVRINCSPLQSYQHQLKMKNVGGFQEAFWQNVIWS